MCFKYNQGAPLPPVQNLNPDPLIEWNDRTAFLKTHVTTFQEGPAGLSVCSASCQKIPESTLYGVCGHRAGNTKTCVYESLQFCRDNRDLSFPVDEEGESVDCQVWARA